MPGKRILVVEDDPSIRNLLGSILRDEGYDVVDAADGLQALDRLQRGPAPGIILLDMRMRVMDGMAFRYEQKKHPEWSTIPVVAMTAGRASEAEMREFSDRLEKPVELDHLLDTIRKHCR